MTAPENFFTLVLETTYKKVFLKYQINARFPSLCLASENAIFGGGKRRKKKKKVGKPIGHPVRTGCPNYLGVAGASYNQSSHVGHR